MANLDHANILLFGNELMDPCSKNASFVQSDLNHHCAQKHFILQIQEGFTYIYKYS